jgi:hypothetical protein
MTDEVKRDEPYGHRTCGAGEGKMGTFWAQ